MKRALLTIFLFHTLLFATLGQNDHITVGHDIEPDMVAKEAVGKIVQYTGLTPNFVVVADRRISTAIAYIKNNTRYIAYNPKFIEELDNKSFTNWASVSVLAHEIGHHLAGHTLPRSSSPGNELAADRFSGFILFQMGAKLNEAMAALSTIGHEMDTTKHPPKNARLAAIEEGWKEAKRLRNTRAYSKDSETEDIVSVRFVYQCQFNGDDNIYFVDEKDNIIWYDNYGKPIVIGLKKASSNNKYAWIYNYLDNYYGVDHKGKIWKETTYGSIFIVGEAKLIDKESD